MTSTAKHEQRLCNSVRIILSTTQIENEPHIELASQHDKKLNFRKKRKIYSLTTEKGLVCLNHTCSGSQCKTPVRYHLIFTDCSFDKPFVLTSH